MKFDISNCVLLNLETGEQHSLDVVMTKEGGRFDKVFREELASMIGCTGGGSDKVIGWILKNKNSNNEVFGTQRSIAEEAGVSVPTVTKVIKSLKDGGYMKSVRTGVFLIDPKVIYYGGEMNKMFILKVWNSLK